MNKTLSIIKPDATSRNITGAINSIIEKQGIKIIAQKRIKLSKEQASEFYKNMSCGQIIVVSSATVNWQSWPGIELPRLIYSTAKTALSNFCMYMNRKNIPGQEEKPISIQVYEPNNFVSRMGIDSEQDIKIVAEELFSLVNNSRISILQSLNRSV